MKKIPVLLVGAGPVGLSMALSLACQTENAVRFFDIFKAIRDGDNETLKIKLYEQ